MIHVNKREKYDTRSVALQNLQGSVEEEQRTYKELTLLFPGISVIHCISKNYTVHPDIFSVLQQRSPNFCSNVWLLPVTANHWDQDHCISKYTNLRLFAVSIRAVVLNYPHSPGTEMFSRPLPSPRHSLRPTLP